MLKTRTILALLAAPLLLSGCQGLHRSGNLTSAHAESLHLLGFQIPGSAQDKLETMVPKSAELVTVVSVPEDLDSVYGFLNRVLGVGYSTATWKENK